MHPNRHHPQGDRARLRARHTGHLSRAAARDQPHDARPPPPRDMPFCGGSGWEQGGAAQAVRSGGRSRTSAAPSPDAAPPWENASQRHLQIKLELFRS
mmetsp:Transcript_37939/g.46248  ORF Transcript_37939/g.46248 Transcript_37939/m.46248 type:complete len:98 (-) Transcript_37939:450-743(-)